MQLNTTPVVDAGGEEGVWVDESGTEFEGIYATSIIKSIVKSIITKGESDVPPGNRNDQEPDS